MRDLINEIYNRIISTNGEISYEEAILLDQYDFDSDEESLKELYMAANKLREKFNGDKFDLCTIVNGKSGNCSEDCKYCAQSSYYQTTSPIYPLMSSENILQLAKDVENRGVDRFSIVTSGRGLEIGEELSHLKSAYETLKSETSLGICASHGIISYDVALELKKSGVETYHHNLETSENFYPEICTTHSYQDRIDTCLAAKKAGLKICSGGIFGLGESSSDRIDMAFTLKSIDVDSIPINILTVIEGTPLALLNIKPLNPKDILKTIAIYKLILPHASIRYAGGRQLLGEYEKIGIRAGVSAALTGNYLTTTGSTVERDREIALEAGFNVK